MSEHEPQLLLGKSVPTVDEYSPQLLYPIARQDARRSLGLGGELPFVGVDIWHAYELSWLDAQGRPTARVGRFTVDALTPNIVESKSLKLYLNSINNTSFASDAVVEGTICRDVSAAVGGPVELHLFAADDPVLAGVGLPGECIDAAPLGALAGAPDADILELADEAMVEERLFSHLLRSLCPVTGQPDWASLWLHYRGPALDRGALLRYILAYRQHQEFHEQCVERMFCDLREVLNPEFLHLQAFYTRRGGLDINPFRSTSASALPRPRLNRQ